MMRKFACASLATVTLSLGPAAEASAQAPAATETPNTAQAPPAPPTTPAADNPVDPNPGALSFTGNMDFLAGTPYIFRGIVQEIRERLEQEITEPATVGIGVPEPVTFQHHKKKILGKILCVERGMAAPADERKDGPPIEPAKFRQRMLSLLIVASEIGRGQDETPARCGEVSRAIPIFDPDIWGHERG